MSSLRLPSPPAVLGAVLLAGVLAIHVAQHRARAARLDALFAQDSFQVRIPRSGSQGNALLAGIAVGSVGFLGAVYGIALVVTAEQFPWVMAGFVPAWLLGCLQLGAWFAERTPGALLRFDGTGLRLEHGAVTREIAWDRPFELTVVRASQAPRKLGNHGKYDTPGHIDEWWEIRTPEGSAVAFTHPVPWTAGVPAHTAATLERRRVAWPIPHGGPVLLARVTEIAGRVIVRREQGG